MNKWVKFLIFILSFIILTVAGTFITLTFLEFANAPISSDIEQAVLLGVGLTLLATGFILIIFDLRNKSKHDTTTVHDPPLFELYPDFHEIYENEILLNSLLDDLNAEINFFGTFCPVQAEGEVDAKYFYFRARGESWSIEINKKDSGDIDWHYEEDLHCEQFKAGYMSEIEAKALIVKAILLYKHNLFMQTGHRNGQFSD